MKNLLSASFFTRFLYLLLGFITSIVMNRYLGPTNKGIYTLIITLSAVAVMFFEFGLPISNVYYYGRKKIKFNELFQNSIFLSIFFSILSISFAYLFIKYSKNNIYRNISWEIMFFLFLLIPIELFGRVFRGFIDALQEYKLILLNLLFQGIFTLLSTIVVLIIFKYSIKSLLIIVMLSVLISNMIIFWKIKNKIIPKLQISILRMRNLITYGFKNYLFFIVSNLNARLDFLIIGYFLNPYYVGLYSLSKKMAELSKELPISLNTILIPKISSSNKNDIIFIINKSTRLNIFVSSIIAIVLIIFGKILINFVYGKAFILSYFPLIFLLPAIIFYNPIDLLGTFFNLYLGKPMINFWIHLCALILNLILNIILIPQFKIQGAAVSAAISYFGNAMTQYYIYMRFTKINFWELFIIKKSELLEYYNYFKKLIVSGIKTK